MEQNISVAGAVVNICYILINVISIQIILSILKF